MRANKTGLPITPQVLRRWFGTKIGELDVHDRYLDIYQGRAPRTVIAKHYTGRGFERLKMIYYKVGLKVQILSSLRPVKPFDRLLPT